MLTHLSLFSGIGGIDLAAEWAGFETVCFVEKDKFCQKVLAKHWPNVPIVGDIHGFTWPEAVTLISGGFPCQSVSLAGERRGEKDDRWLWPEMFRVISETQPLWAIIENVAGLINMGLSGILSDLEDANFRSQAFVISAGAVGAHHRRDRTFIVAHSAIDRLQEPFQKREVPRQTDERETSPLANDSFEGWIYEGRIWPSNARVRRVADGIPNRVDRLKSIGNAVVPQQVYPFFRAIAEIERNESTD